MKNDIKHNYIKLKVESVEDLWHLQHIITKGDIISGTTFRRTQTKSIENTRGEKKKVFLKISVEKIEFSEFTSKLRVSGKIIQGPDDISLGSYHTFVIETDTIIAIEKEWKKYHLERLKEATRLTKQILVIIVEPGESHIALVHGYGVKHIGKITENLPSKRIEPENYSSEEIKFYKKVVEDIENRLSDDIYGIIIAGPGWAKDKLGKIMRKKITSLPIVVVGINTVAETGVSEVMRRGIVSQLYKESKCGQDAVAVNRLLEEIGKDSGLAVYGLEEVKKAVDCSAVKHLLLTDKLFTKANNEGWLHKLDKLMEAVNYQKGIVSVVSTEDEAGEKLDSLGGIAAILRYRIS